VEELLNAQQGEEREKLEARRVIKGGHRGNLGKTTIECRKTRRNHAAAIIVKAGQLRGGGEEIDLPSLFIAKAASRREKGGGIGAWAQ